MSPITLRHETPQDYHSVEALTREAFWNHHVPGCDEHYLLHTMRAHDLFIEDLDYVAEIDGKLVGNIVYAHSKIIGDGGQDWDVITFGPVSVLPAYQSRGIGGKLIRHTIEQAKALGYRAILIYGDPDYYSRFGFVDAERYDIRTSDNMYAVPLQALELRPGALTGCSGCFVEGPAYDFDPQAPEEFDRLFPQRDKQSGLPSQKRFEQLVNMKRPRP